VYAELEDYRRGRIWRGSKRQRVGGGRQDKGFAAQFRFLAELARGRVEAPPPGSFLLSSLATLAAARSLESGQPESVVLSAEPDRGPESAPAKVEAMAGHGR
jgi:hypothetical protein